MTRIDIDKNIKLHQGDCLDVMKTLGDGGAQLDAYAVQCMGVVAKLLHTIGKCYRARRCPYMASPLCYPLFFAFLFQLPQFQAVLGLASLYAQIWQNSFNASGCLFICYLPSLDTFGARRRAVSCKAIASECLLKHIYRLRLYLFNAYSFAVCWSVAVTDNTHRICVFFNANSSIAVNNARQISKFYSFHSNTVPYVEA